MDNKTKLRGIRTSLKMAVNILERLELNQDDWVVGCRCENVEKGLLVKNLLTCFLSYIGDLEVVMNEECSVEVRYSKTSKAIDEKPQNLVISVIDRSQTPYPSDKESLCSDTSSASSASDKEEQKDDYDKACESIDDCISAFQAKF